jgi:hypothetical protein
MKNQIKNRLSEFGLLAPLDNVRRTYEKTKWINDGCAGIAPPPIKRKILSSYLRKYGLKKFIETGTHLGDTLAHIAHDKSMQCISIELSEHYFSLARDRFRKWKNIELLCGDSGSMIESVVTRLEGPALFWLDGHYSGGLTAKGDSETPVSQELMSILQSDIKSHVILIDDARCFNGTHDYPHLDDLLREIRLSSDYCVDISTDIIRLTPAIPVQ